MQQSPSTGIFITEKIVTTQSDSGENKMKKIFQFIRKHVHFSQNHALMLHVLHISFAWVYQFRLIPKFLLKSFCKISRTPSRLLN